MGLIDLLRHGPVDADRQVEGVKCSWPVAELIVNRIELRQALDRQIDALGKVLPDPLFDVFAAARLPRTVWVKDVDLDARVGAQLCMPRHLLSLVVRQNLAQGFGNAVQLGRKAFQGRCGRGVGEPLQNHQTRAVLGQHTCGRAVTSALDEVAFPVPETPPFIGHRGPRLVAQHFGQLPSATLSSTARHALALGSVQTGNQFPSQLLMGHGVIVDVYRLLRDGALGVIWPHSRECVCDSRGRPLLRQILGHNAEEHGVRCQFGAMPGFDAMAASLQTSSAGIVGTFRSNYRSRMVLPSDKAHEFAGEGRGRAMQGTRNVPRRASLATTQHHDRGSLCRGGLYVVRPYPYYAERYCILLLILVSESLVSRCIWCFGNLFNRKKMKFHE